MHMSCLLFLNIDIIINKVYCIIVNVSEHARIEVRGQIVTRKTTIIIWVLLGTGWMPQSGCGRVRMRTHARLISRPGHVLMLYIYL